MAVDVAAEDVDEFLGYAREENLEATVIATVTEDPRMVMTWNGDKIVNLSREFLGVQRRLQASGRARRGAGGVRGARLVARRLAGRPHERGRHRPQRGIEQGSVRTFRFDDRSRNRAHAVRWTQAAHPERRPWSPSSLCSARPRPLRPWRGASTRTSCRRTSSPAHTCRSSSRCRSWSRPVSNTRRRT